MTNRRAALAVAITLVVTSLTGCVVVGYSSGRGWTVWPGGLALACAILFVLFLLRRRR